MKNTQLRSKIKLSRLAINIMLLIMIGLSISTYASAQVPQIINVYVDEITPSKIIISFTTDVPANYSLRYGVTPEMEDRKFDSIALNTEKKISISNIYSSRTYSYEITLCDSYSNCKTYGPFKFKTGKTKSSTDTNIEEKTWMVMSPGSNMMYLSNADMNIQNIDIRLSQEEQNTKITVKKLVDRPDGLDYLKFKNYRYFLITKMNIPDTSIIFAEFDFLVSKQWLRDSMLNPENIALYYFDDAWEQLDTFIQSTDADNVYYSASHNKLGYFAIAYAENQNMKQALEDSVPDYPNASLENISINEYEIDSRNSSNPTNDSDDNNNINKKNSDGKPNQNIETETPAQTRRFLSKEVMTIISSILGIIFLAAIVFGLFINIKGDKRHFFKLLIFKEKNEINIVIKKINYNLKKGNAELAKQEYEKLRELYKELTKEEKDKHYPQIEQILKKI